LLGPHVVAVTMLKKKKEKRASAADGPEGPVRVLTGAIKMLSADIDGDSKWFARLHPVNDRAACGC